MSNETKSCGFCGEEILEKAIKCKHCGEFFEDPNNNQKNSVEKKEENLTPKQIKLRKVLRIALIIEWSVGILCLFSSLAFEFTLPVVLQEYLANLSEQSSATETIFGLLCLVVLIIYIITTINLFLFNHWAKYVYIIIIGLFIFLSLFSGATVENAITSTFNYIASITSGFIIALLIFTDVLKKNETSENVEILSE